LLIFQKLTHSYYTEFYLLITQLHIHNCVEFYCNIHKTDKIMLLSHDKPTTKFPTWVIFCCA